MSKRYQEAVNFLEGLSNIKLKQQYMKYRGNPQVYIDRTNYFLNLLGNPQNDFDIIHVTGTAGKGSVSNMLHSVLTQSGKKTGLFTSPYTTTSIEKIKVGELFIDPEEFADIVDEIKPIINKTYLHSPHRVVSYFEIFMAIAFLYFRRQNCDWVVLEVGMGGRYDASNVVKNTKVSVITNIDLDHTNLLGETIEEIASDKAGIIKKGSMVFTSEKREHIRKIFIEEAEKVGAEFNYVETDANPNAELVNEITKYLGISFEDRSNGIENSKLQCRFELMQDSPKVIIDGAHNKIKIKYLIDKLQDVEYEKLHLVVGSKAGKDPDHIYGQLLPLADYLYATRYQKVGYFPGFECLSPVEIIELSEKYHKDISKELFLDPNQALKSALKRAGPKDLVLITGSLYLCGELRTHWVSEEYILENRKSFL